VRARVLVVVVALAAAAGMLGALATHADASPGSAMAPVAAAPAGAAYGAACGPGSPAR
jgi:hypothetical protein